MTNYIIIILITILVLVCFIIPTIWCYDPTLLVNLKYKSNIHIKNFEKPSLFICNFNNRDHQLDQILACREAIDTKLKLNIISWHDEASRLSRILKKLPLFAKYNLIYTKNNLIKNCREKLKKEHVWLFLKDDWKNKGAYHILKDLNVPIVFVKFKHEKELNKDLPFSIISNTFNRKINVTYEKYDKYDMDKNPEKFMEWVKSNIYD